MNPRAGKRGQALLLALTLLSLAGCTKPAKHTADKVEDIHFAQSGEATVSEYVAQILSAVKARADDFSGYAGKRCSVKIRLDPDGTLSGVQPTEGDPAFCHALKTAMYQARLPKPPTAEIYNLFKDTTLYFDAGK